MLADSEAPNCFGLAHAGEQWQFLLVLSDVDDGLVTPTLQADTQTPWHWRGALLEAHLPNALKTLRERGIGSRGSAPT